jgi:leucyl-tRNA synthetase
VREALDGMELIPPECLTYFKNVVDWLNDWPCTRRVGLGTRLPWDDTGWIIESLSDSTIYMAYYTLVPWMRKIKPEQLNDSVFDLVFLKKGDAPAISKQTGIPEGVLKGMQDEFHYWYPQNYRVSANELIPNHLTFMVFHHLAMFPKELCPQGIVSLGLGVLEGRRMSSSKGVVFAVSDAVDQFGADVTRLYLMYMCEPPQDFDWRGVQADAHRRQMERFFILAQETLALDRSAERPVDRWMLSRLQHHVSEVGEALDSFQTRKALQHAFFLLQQDLKWYMRRGGANKHVLRTVLETQVRMLTPFTPHVCEEIWEMLGNQGFISNSSFPVPDESKRDPLAEFTEDIVESVTQDIGEILKVTKLTPKKVVLYASPAWKWKVFRKAVEMARGGHLYMSGLMKALTPEPDLKPHAKELAKYAQKIVADIPKLSAEQLAQYSLPLNEMELLADAKDFLAAEFSCEVQVFSADDPKKPDPADKAKHAVPVRPAIFVE